VVEDGRGPEISACTKEVTDEAMPQDEGRHGRIDY